MVTKRLRSALPAALCLAVLSGCNTPPPTPWLRYEVAGDTEWADLGPGRYGGSLEGVDVEIDLRHPDTNMLVTVANPTDAEVIVQIGASAGGADGPLGDVLLRRIEPVEAGGPDMMPCVGMQKVAVPAGWRATYYLDRPLGRPMKLGQFFVFETRVTPAEGGPRSHRLPVLARQSGTSRPSRR